jgi:hypothetical protein
MADILNTTNAPDCANCDRPLRAICALLAENIDRERRALEIGPCSDRERRVADLVVSERLQAQLWRQCVQPECLGKALRPPPPSPIEIDELRAIICDLEDPGTCPPGGSFADAQRAAQRLRRFLPPTMH